MSNSMRPLRTLRTGLWVQWISKTRFIRCARLDGCKWILHFWQSSHLRLVAQGKVKTNGSLSDSLMYPVPATLPVGFS